MLVSILIPTRNRARSLATLLKSLERVNLCDPSRMEILVIDNGSTDETPSMLKDEQLKNRLCSLTVLREDRPGKARALNCGLAMVGGELIIILDDDVTVDRNCIAKHIEAYGQSNFAAIQGRVLPGKDPEGRDADPSRLREYNIPIVDYGDKMIPIRGLIGTNMSVKRGVLEAVGRFDDRLGPGASGFSEDTELSIRICEAGFEIGYTPGAVVYHELNPARYGRAYNRDVE